MFFHLFQFNSSRTKAVNVSLNRSLLSVNLFIRSEEFVQTSLTKERDREREREKKKLFFLIGVHNRFIYIDDQQK